ncbi:hypothetical protein ACPEEZ_04660 [Frigoribacterium sp. 2-23]|uniref:hypothetical protein n=1 Tax=Frigoribacterium sp. 2-23 TaxID=3415006 RepID=UPI003C6F930E
MGLLDRLLGRDHQNAPGTGAQPPSGQVGAQPPYGQAAGHQPSGSGQGAPAQRPRTDDEIAVERYRYLLRTAPPETIEQVHAEAFGTLTAEQRRLVFDQLSAESPASERPRGDDAASLAQAATRSELRQPGTLERTLGAPQTGGAAGRQGPGIGSIIGGSLLGTVAGYVIGSTLMNAFLPDAGADLAGGGADQGDAGAADQSDAGAADQSDAGAADAGAGADTTGTDTADAGGDGGFFGGGDMGGADFGGGFGDFDI